MATISAFKAPHRLLSPGELVTLVAQHLELNQQEGSDFPTLITNAVRAALWSASKGSVPAYVTRVLNSAARQLPPPLLDTLTSGNEEAVSLGFREALDQIAVIGDVSELPGGYWLPAPLRAVPMAASGHWLLVGGVPTQLLPTLLRRVLHHSGGGRLLDTAPSACGVPLPEQPLEDWIGRPDSPLETWATEALGQARLLPVSETTEGWEIYYPAAGGSLQHFRWQPLAPSIPDGRFLARSPLGWGVDRYRVVVIRRGKLAESGPPLLGHGDLRRLLYGLDALAGQSIPIKLRQTRQEATIEVRNMLPGPEQRLMHALGRVEMPADGKFYPQRWRLPIAQLPEIDRALAELRVELRSIE